MASSSTDSRDAIRALASREKELSSQLKRLAAAQAVSAKRRRLSGFTHAEQTFAVRLYVLAAHDVKIPILFLKEKQITRTAGNYPILSDDALKLLVEDWFVLLTEDELSTLHNPVLPQQKKLHDRATKFVHEHRLRLWVLQQNILKGLAPTTSTMNMQFDGITSGGAEYEVDDPATRGDVSVSRNRMWALRFRSRWDIHLGKVPSRERMDTHVLTEKVAVPWYGVYHFPRLCFLSGLPDGPFTNEGSIRPHGTTTTPYKQGLAGLKQNDQRGWEIEVWKEVGNEKVGSESRPCFWDRLIVPIIGPIENDPKTRAVFRPQFCKPNDLFLLSLTRW
jgi:hypothetical protein